MTPPFFTAAQFPCFEWNGSHLRLYAKWCRTVRVRDDNSTIPSSGERSAHGVVAAKNFPAEISENVGAALPSELKDRRGRIERWEADKATAEGEIFQRVAEGETLKQICRLRRWPYSMVAKWVGETPSVFKAYEFALRLWADSLAVETVEIADGTDATEVGLGKLRTDTRIKLASRLDRQRYGDKVEVSGEVRHTHSLIGILQGLAGGEVVEAEVVGIGAATALPAPPPVSADQEHEFI